MAMKQTRKKASRKKRRTRGRDADVEIVINRVPRVVPGRGRVREGQKIVWLNQSGERLLLIFPHDHAFGKGSKGFVKALRDQASHRTGNLDGPTKGTRLEYHVFSESAGFVPGGSEPEIIII